MGQVGSGKTVVALYAMLRAVESGGQAALMAPTEMLAEQHCATLQKLCGASGCTSRCSPARPAVAPDRPAGHAGVRRSTLVGTTR